MIYSQNKEEYEILRACARRLPMLNITNEFRQPVSIDFAPAGSVCEWCGKPAMQKLTVLRGVGHNDSGYFCSGCSREFIRVVASGLRREVPSATGASEVP